MLLEKTLRSPLDSKEIKPVNPKGSQSWIFTGKTDAEAEALIHWTPDAKCQLTYIDAGKDWRQKEMRVTEDEMVGWHHWLNGHGFEQTPGDGEGQGRLACCSSWGCEELNRTERLNNKYCYKHWKTEFLLKKKKKKIWWDCACVLARQNLARTELQLSLLGWERESSLL